MASGCSGCLPETEVEEVRLITRRNRSDDWVNVAAPGDLLLHGDRPGKGGGTLRIKHGQAFLTLNEAQVWRREPVPWPFDETISTFRIIGTKVTYFRK